MRTLKFSIILLSITLAFFSCKRNPLKVNISNIKKDIKIIRFDKELFSMNLTNSIEEIVEFSNQNTNFFNLFTYRIIRIGSIDDEYFQKLIVQFIEDPMILDLKKLVDEEFSDFEKTEKQLNTAFKYYQYHFPEKEIPTVYTYISGFNQSVVTAENMIGISLDKYLGKDCHYYQKLSTTPMYKIKNMHKEKVVSDVVYAWGITEFDETGKTTNLLANMIYQGKLMYFVDALLPDTNDTLKIGYSQKQLEWCENNEAKMWMSLVEKKLLYSNQRMDILRYINDGPTTNGFPLDSPARTGIWLGWQIVRQYMEKNPEIKVADLMKNTNYQEILNASAYYPE